MSLTVQSPYVYKLLDYVNKNVSSDTQRLVLGGTAILTQPIIDLKNKKVDDDTRWTSAMKTIAKIVVGTAVGIAVRHYAIKWVRKSPRFWRQPGDKAAVCEYPGEKFFNNIDFSNKKAREINNYANTVGTIIGTIACLFTNFAVDAPLTNLFTNYLKKNVQPVCMAHFCGKNDKEV